MGNRLFVGNISFRATPDMIRSEFASFGEVSDVHLPMDRETGRMRGFAFVTMATDAAAQAAIAGMNGKSIEGRPLVVHTAKRPEPEIPQEVECPDYAKLLPEPIQRFTTKGVYDADDHQHLSFTQGAGHGGSHPHLVHEFVNALVENKVPYPNAAQSANITCVGILAHESAKQGGKIINLPAFTFAK
jgi:RNA recognition motif-containing protein